MTLRNYSSTAAETTLSAGVDASATTLAVSSTTGFPSTPFILAVDAGAAAQELVLVTNVAGTNLTVTRAYDSTVASAHDTGAAVAHSHGAIDFREANAHVNASSGVHGRTGDVVGTSDAQTLTNKTLSLGSNILSGTKAQFNAAVTNGDPVWADEAGVGQAFTPTITAELGTFTSASATGHYAQIGKLVHFSASITITTAGTASGGLLFTLPTPARAINLFLGGGRDSLGAMLQHYTNTTSNAYLFRYDNASIIADGRTATISGVYEAA